MASNGFGKIFKITTWGESHGKAVGVVIDGCLANIPITQEEIYEELKKRRPGDKINTSIRKERDYPHILSGVKDGKTTGAPISILIRNEDPDSDDYDKNKHLYRPSHATYPYLEKYGVYDSAGGGRASARETACRVAAGAIAKKILRSYDIEVLAYICEIGGVKANINKDNLKEKIKNSPYYCPDDEACLLIKKMFEKDKNDSFGGIVDFIISNNVAGLGDPIYDKIDARLAFALMGIPAVKGIEIGSGFKASSMKGSQHNDGYKFEGGRVRTIANNSGGILAGITTGEEIYGTVVFKPTPTINKDQKTIDIKEKKEANFQKMSKINRHDPCVAIRGVCVVEAMCAIVMVDALLMNQVVQKL